MSAVPSNSYTSFAGHQRIAAGSLQANALAVKRALESGVAGPVLLFDDETGRSMDIDTSGSEEALAERVESATRACAQDSSAPLAPDSGLAKSRGRPKLGVVPREVTLLPRHWAWLAEQPGGASVALRKLVEEARRANAGKDRMRRAQERAYHFMLAMAGDLAGFEEATRALFANDSTKLQELITAWPGDVRDHVLRLATIA